MTIIEDIINYVLQPNNFIRRQGQYEVYGAVYKGENWMVQDFYFDFNREMGTLINLNTGQTFPFNFRYD